jgi:hypothetical protein
MGRRKDALAQPFPSSGANMPKATWEEAILAESENTVVVESNH